MHFPTRAVSALKKSALCLEQSYRDPGVLSTNVVAHLQAGLGRRWKWNFVSPDLDQRLLQGLLTAPRPSPRCRWTVPLRRHRCWAGPAPTHPVREFPQPRGSRCQQGSGLALSCVTGSQQLNCTFNVCHLMLSTKQHLGHPGKAGPPTLETLDTPKPGSPTVMGTTNFMRAPLSGTTANPPPLPFLPLSFKIAIILN